jgi:hypothetical protein
MQAAKLYMNHATDRVERALNQMPSTTGASRPLPSSMQEITRYVEQLLTPAEQTACDMATD